MTWEIFAKFAF